MMTLMDEIARALYETPEAAAAFLRGRAKIVGEETLNGRVYTQIAKDYEEVAHDLGRYIEMNTQLSAQVTALLDITDGLMSFAGEPLTRDREAWGQEVEKFAKLRAEIYAGRRYDDPAPRRRISP